MHTTKKNTPTHEIGKGWIDEDLQSQTSALKKLSEALKKSKPRKTLLWLAFICLSTQAFSQSASMTWISGPNTADSAGTYGVDNLPGSRRNSASTTDLEGNVWVYGGEGYDKNGNEGFLSDLWKWNGRTWTWLSGSDIRDQLPSYGTKGVAASGNNPGSRDNSMCWVDTNGTFWLFGGRKSHMNDYNDLWKWDGTYWTWVSGSSSVNATGVYGTKNTTSSSSTPGARNAGLSWTDSDNSLWLFGGRSPVSGYNFHNDLWKWDGTNWTWISGSSSLNSLGDYGTKGLASSNNVPPARMAASKWKDANGNFWVFGGWTNISGFSGFLNDLWKWDGTNWTWISGSHTTNTYGVYGTKGVTSSTSYPGARQQPALSIDKNGKILLYGGYGRASSGSSGYLKDLWKWDGTNWTWLSGSTTTSTSSPNFGTKGIASSSNHPSQIYAAISWIDLNDNFILQFGSYYSSPTKYYYNSQWKWDGTNWTWTSGPNTANQAGNYGEIGGGTLRQPGARKSLASCSQNDESLWIYGGVGYDKNGNEGHLNDLWKRDPSTGYWTWMNGSNEQDIAAVYGTKGTAASANTPGKREDALLWSYGNDLWLFGGKYEDGGTDYHLNDLWKWNGTEWTWVSGSSTPNASGTYTGTPMPGARIGSSKWVDNSGNLWLFGGRGYDKNGDLGRLSDLWKFDGTNWTYVKGSDLKNAACVYGTKGVSASTNMPGSRSGSSFWKDADGNFWFFGGDGHDASSSYGSFNDVWKWDGTNWTWMYGNNTRNELGVYGTQHIASASNIPGARKASTAWQDQHGFLWVFGGYGFGESGGQGRLNDLWKFDGSQWIWIKGDKATGANADYNTINSTDYSSIIGGRSAHTAYVVNNAAFIFGGASLDENGNTGSFNDTWRIDIDYSIENGKSNSIFIQELSLSASESSGGALINAGDKITIDEVNGTWAEVDTDLWSNSIAIRRFNKTWTLTKNDANSNGGNFDLAFDLGTVPNSDYSYYLMYRNGSSGNFSIENNLNYKLQGNQVIFTLSLSNLNSGNQYTLGRSDKGAGYALNFDKTPSIDHIDIGVGLDPRYNDFSVECWFKADAISGQQVLVAQYDGSGTGRPMIRIESNGKLSSRLGGVTTTGSTAVVADKWYHAALVSDGYNLFLYLNGAMEFGPAPITAESANGSWLLGMNDNGSDAFDGDMDEVRIWNDDRSAKEILKNMFAPLRGNETDLLAYYKFDQTGGSYLPDVSSGNGYGTLSSFSNTGTNSNWVPSTCPIVDKEDAKKLIGPGNALDFDGTDDIVTTTLDVQPSALATTTWEAWIYPTRLNHSSLQAIFSNDDGGYDRFVMIKPNSNKFYVSKGNGFFEPDYEMAANEWMHIAVVYKNDNILFYANGIRYEHGSAEVSTASNWYFSIGGADAIGFEFKGKIDDVRVWNDERTQTEIQDNMYASLDGDEDGLVAYYDFDHTSGTSLEDQSSNNYTGTLKDFSGTYWVSANDREPFKTVRAGAHSSNNTWKGGTAPSTSTDKLAVFHDLSLSSTASYSRLQVNSGQTVTADADITVTGEVIVNGTADGLSKVILNGSSKQSLGGSGSLHNLQVNNGNDVSLEGDLSITGSLTLTNGDIEINDRTLTISEFVLGGSANSYLKINGNGVVKTTVGSSPITLPIGRNPYLPIVIDDGGDAEFTVGVAEKVYDNPQTQANEQTTLVVTETWSIQASAAVNDVSVTLQWDAAQEASGFDRSQVYLAYWENGVSGHWKGGTNGSASGSGPYTFSRTINFSTNQYYFGLGSSGSLLPVELSYFNATWLEKGKSAQLTWATASETNNSHFEVQRALITDTERSQSGSEAQMKWETIGHVQGQGTTFSPTQYSFTDNKLATGNSGLETVFYRLKQVDFSGQYEYSSVKTLHSEPETRNFLIYPNPSFGSTLHTTIQQTYYIYDVHGNCVKTCMETFDINVEDLTSGTYVIRDQKGNAVLFVRS